MAQKAVWKNRTLITLGLVSLLADISADMLYPITPIFLSQILGASMTSLGLIEGLADGVASLLKSYSGFYSDRWATRKPFIVGGYLLAALAKPLTGMASRWEDVLLARSLDRVGKGIRTSPRDALLADAFNENEMGQAFGWHRAADTLGAALGPMIALYLYQKKILELREFYFWALVPGLLAVTISLFIRETKISKKYPSQPKPSFRKLGLNFYLFSFAWALFCLSNSSDAFLLMKAHSKGFGLETMILLYCFYNLLSAFLSPLFGRVSDRLGKKNVLLGSLLIFSLCYFSMTWAEKRWEFFACLALYGVFLAMSEGVVKAYAAQLIGPRHRATAFGFLGTLTGFATILASTFAGVLWDRVNANACFLISSIGGVASFLVVLFLPKVENQNT